jgi:putative flippase GtrA
MVRFAFVGVVNTANYYLLYLLFSTVLPYLAAHTIAFCLAMIGSYFMNCRITFRVQPTLRTFLLFPLSNLTNFVVTSLGLYLLVAHLQMSAQVAPLLAAAAAVPITFVVTHLVLVGHGQHRPTPRVRSAAALSPSGGLPESGG